MEFQPVLLIEFVLFPAVIFAWVGWELWSLRKDERSAREDDRSE